MASQSVRLNGGATGRKLAATARALAMAVYTSMVATLPAAAVAARSLGTPCPYRADLHAAAHGLAAPAGVTGFIGTHSHVVPRVRSIERAEPGELGDCWATVELAANAPFVGQGEHASPLGRRWYGHHSGSTMRFAACGQTSVAQTVGIPTKNGSLAP